MTLRDCIFAMSRKDPQFQACLRAGAKMKKKTGKGIEITWSSQKSRHCLENWVGVIIQKSSRQTLTWKLAFIRNNAKTRTGASWSSSVRWKVCCSIGLPWARTRRAWWKWASKYQLYLPKREELQGELEKLLSEKWHKDSQFQVCLRTETNNTCWFLPNLVQ